jgi:4-amino-4-deoxy-L-arabinose transferase-like glycosyltransferase
LVVNQQHRTGGAGWLFEAIDASHFKALSLLFFFGCVLFIPGLGVLQPMDRDEPRFAQASKQMLETGDFVDIRFQDEARHKKPVGIYWLQATSVAVGNFVGVKDAQTQIWLYRLPSLLGAVLSLMATYWAGLAFLARRSAFLAALIFGATLLMGVEARLAKTDAMLCALTVASLGALAHAYVASIRDERLPTAMTVLFWIAMALALLIKGPITAAIVFFAAVAGVIGRSGGQWLKPLFPWWGPVLLLLIVLPWFAAIMVKSGGEFFTSSVGQDMLGKVAGAQERHGGPPGTYLIAFFATAWPLAPLLCLALPFVWQSRREANVLFLVGWIVPFWIILEFVPTKLPHYVLPLYPALAILAVMAAERGKISVDGVGVKLAQIWIVLLPVIIVAVLGFGAMWLGDAIPIVALLVLLLALWPAFEAARCLAKGFIGQTGLYAAIASCVIACAAYQFASPQLQSIRLSERMADAFKSAPCATGQWAATGYAEPSLVFLTRTDLHLVSAEGMVDFLAGAGCRMGFVSNTQTSSFEKAMQEKGMDLKPALEISGFNINGGKRLIISLYVKEDTKP